MKLQELAGHFYDLYGRRNDLFMPDLRMRLDFLNFGIADWQDGIRKHRDSERVMRVAAARVVSRIFCVNHSFPTIELGKYMAMKFKNGCGYCHHAPCQCDPGIRRDLDLNTYSNPVQHEWSLRQWSDHLGLVYGVRNREAGVENVLNRLQSELAEFLRLVAAIPTGLLTIDVLELNLGLELADLMAWTIGLAYVLDTDLERSVFDYYGDGCSVCHSNSCRCSKHNILQIDWKRWLAQSEFTAASEVTRF
jgi:hypothetical protein